MPLAALAAERTLPMRPTTITLLAGLAALPLLVALALTRPSAQEDVAPDRAATEAIVRDYLLENPEVIVEALERWRDQREAEAQTLAEEASQTALPMFLSGEAGFAMGAAPGEADVLVVEFFDYHCGYCQRAADFVFDLAEEDGVRVVLQDLPILRQESREAALAGLAAAEAGAYPAMHRELMRASGVLDDRAVQKAARRADADGALAVLADEAARARLEAKLAASVDAARAMGLDGTPSFVVAEPGGALIRVIPSYAPEAVQAAIDEVRAL